MAWAVLSASTVMLVATSLAPDVARAGATDASVKASVPSPTVQGPILPASGISFLGSTLFSLSAGGIRGVRVLPLWDGDRIHEQDRR